MKFSGRSVALRRERFGVCRPLACGGCAETKVEIEIAVRAGSDIYTGPYQLSTHHSGAFGRHTAVDRHSISIIGLFCGNRWLCWRCCFCQRRRRASRRRQRFVRPVGRLPRMLSYPKWI